MEVETAVGVGAFAVKVLTMVSSEPCVAAQIEDCEEN